LAEAQIMGQLDHPGVVSVHEIGVNERGEPYFTMTLVQGRHLGEIIRQARKAEDGWSITRVLEVLVKVCDTLAYAHSKKVVHRDLKPSNVMVGRFGEVYVMDWGLAKSSAEFLDVASEVEDESAIQTLRDLGSSDESDLSATVEGAVLGTPSYMSPEQADGRIGEVGAQADVYAAGAMLYELLVGHAPFADGASRPTSREVLERLRSGPPRRIEDLARTASAELVAIAEKAMARDPRDRYRGMQEMADDLRAFLEQRVVRSYETGALAEFRKWFRRNRVIATSVAAALFIALASLGGFLWVQVQANQRLQVARAATDREAAILATVVDWMERMFELPRPGMARGREVTAKELIDRARVDLDQGIEDPETLSRLAESVGKLYLELGIGEEAVEVLRTAVRAGNEAHGAGSPHILTLRTLLTVALGRVGEVEQGDRELQELLTALEAAPEVSDAVRANVLNHAAVFQFDRDQFDAAQTFWEQALEHARRGLPRDDRIHLSIRSNLGVLAHRGGRYEEAEELLQQVYQERSLKFGGDHPDSVLTLANLGSVALGQGRFDLARERLEKACELSRLILGPGHPSTLRRLCQLGLVYHHTGAFDRSQSIYEEAYETALEDLSPEDPALHLARRGLAQALSDTGRVPDAAPLLEENLRVAREIVSAGDPRLVRPLVDAARAISGLGRRQEAIQLFREALEIQNRHGQQDLLLTLSLRHGFGTALVRHGILEEALEVLLGAYELGHERLGETSQFTIRATLDLGAAYLASGDDDSAEQYCQEAAEAARAHLPESNQTRWSSLHHLASMLSGWDLHEESYTVVLELLEIANPSYRNYAEYLRLRDHLRRELGETGD
jgi:tetratricopeptide (TPR) repeat protein